VEIQSPGLRALLVSAIPLEQWHSNHTLYISDIWNSYPKLFKLASKSPDAIRQHANGLSPQRELTFFIEGFLHNHLLAARLGFEDQYAKWQLDDWISSYVVASAQEWSSLHRCLYEELPDIYHPRHIILIRNYITGKNFFSDSQSEQQAQWPKECDQSDAYIEKLLNLKEGDIESTVKNLVKLSQISSTPQDHLRRKMLEAAPNRRALFLLLPETQDDEHTGVYRDLKRRLLRRNLRRVLQSNCNTLSDSLAKDATASADLFSLAKDSYRVWRCGLRSIKALLAGAPIESTMEKICVILMAESMRSTGVGMVPDPTGSKSCSLEE
jgi:hypothetical protein